MTQLMTNVRAQRPLPVPPGGSQPINEAAAMARDDQGEVVVFVHGLPFACFAEDDLTAKRAAMVQLTKLGLARSGEVASAFGVDRASVYRLRQAEANQGLSGLVAKKRGPKGAWKVDHVTQSEIVRLRHEKLSYRDIAGRVGVSEFTVRRYLKREVGEAPAAAEPVAPVREVREDEEELPVVPRPEPRFTDRALAAVGKLAEAPVQFTEGRALPLLGLLLAVPALLQVGYLETAEKVFGGLQKGFYGLKSCLLTMVFITLLREPHPEGITRLRPEDLGRLLGLDRAPEVKTLRRKLGELAGRNLAADWQREIAARHLEQQPEALGMLYVDGHVRVYHGQHRVAKHHVARMRLSAPGSLDTWINDARGEPVLVWNSVPNATLVTEMDQVMKEVRGLVDDRRVTVVFDRGGWSPALFARMVENGFDFITYRKGKWSLEPASAFAVHEHEIDGQCVSYDLSDRGVYLKWQKKGVARGKLRRRLRARQVVRRSDNGHQTAIVTSRWDLPAAAVAYRMFERWRQENFFRYCRMNFALDALHQYGIGEDDPEREVPNPQRKELDRQVAAAQRKIRRLEQEYGKRAMDNEESQRPTIRGFKIANGDIGKALRAAQEELAALRQRRQAVPLRVRVAELAERPVIVSQELKRITDVIKMASYRAETALFRLLSPAYSRAEDEGRSLLREAFHTAGDLELRDGCVTITLHPLSAPRRTRALSKLCADLTDTKLCYPGTSLPMRFSVLEPALVDA